MADSSTSLARKLQVQPGEAVHVINAPPSFGLDAETADASDADAVLLFARNTAELDQLDKPWLPVRQVSIDAVWSALRFRPSRLPD
jgi:hypothetical protein